jgi:hypothetical protein
MKTRAKLRTWVAEEPVVDALIIAGQDDDDQGSF